MANQSPEQIAFARVNYTPEADKLDEAYTFDELTQRAEALLEILPTMALRYELEDCLERYRRVSGSELASDPDDETFGEAAEALRSVLDRAETEAYE